MDPLPAAALAAAGGYLCGSIPFAYLAVRWRKGVDLRSLGSGNVGATNAARVLGNAWFPLLFALDFAKGAAPVLLAAVLLPQPRDAPAASLRVQSAAAAGAILGHLFPFALGFRGGKGVATGAGALVLIAPFACAAGAIAFAVVAGVSRFVSLGSVVAAIAAPALFLWFSRGEPADRLLPVALLVCGLGAVIVAKHVPNLRRIAAGTEPRIFGKGEAPRGE
jgi:acyl-phosphate glycerol 3-phosphate acyltransferase